jgi:hypothetical protein
MKLFQGRSMDAGRGSSKKDTESQLVLEQFLPYRLSILSNTVSNTIAREYRDLFAGMAGHGGFGTFWPVDRERCWRAHSDG